MNQPKAKLSSILVATDFSDTAAAGVKWALEIAQEHEARVVLVHVTATAPPMTEFLPVPAAVGVELQRAALERLEKAGAESRTTGIEVQTHLRMGLPSREILEAASEHEPDLLVIGTRGHSGLQHLLLGSTAERVVQRSPFPVLTVHPGDREKHRAIRTVLVPTDFSEDARQAIAQARRLLAPIEDGARVVLLHAYHFPIEYTAYGPIPTSFDFLKDVAGAAEEGLRKLAEELAVEGIEVETRAVEGYPPQVIVEAAAALDADLIAMGTHGRSGIAHLFLGSTAERVVQKAPCPVLTVRRSE